MKMMTFWIFAVIGCVFGANMYSYDALQKRLEDLRNNIAKRIADRQRDCDEAAPNMTSVCGAQYREDISVWAEDSEK